MTDLERIKLLEEQLDFPLKQLPLNKIYDKEKGQFIKEEKRGYALTESGQVSALILDFISTKLYDVQLLAGFEELDTLSLKEAGDELLFLSGLKKLKFLDISWNQITDYSFFKDLNNLNSLDLSGNKITDYSFLKDLKSLNSLNLSRNNISDISFLKDLKSLNSLNLIDNQISDISFLKDLKSLNSLNLSRNNISDISFLKELKSLNSLNLIDNQISDISFLKELKSLNSLDLSDNQISDISFLKELKSLNWLDLSRNKITNFSFLRELKNLNSLFLNNNLITDISFLRDSKSLNSLQLIGNEITNISFLKEIISLSSLDLSFNQITDLSYLKELKSLNSLDLSRNQITDISFLKDLKSLNSLDLSYNQITDISILKNLISLNSLDLSVCQISDFSFLNNLKSLNSLDLSNNQIIDISFLKNLNSLNSLNLSVNQITDISFLKDLTNLKLLNLSNNQITDISFLNDLKSLNSLYLSGNQITDISFLKDLTNLNLLNLGSNQISDISFLKDLTNLNLLNLNTNKISDISTLQELKQLEYLHLYSNIIEDICPLKNLFELTRLNLFDNKIKNITPLEGLINLNYLAINKNQINDISPLSKLNKLNELFLGHKGGNNISDISPLKELKQISRLELQNNPITNIHEWITDFDLEIQWKDYGEVGFITFYNNPLESPPVEIVKQGKERIKEWFKQQEKYGTEKVYEAKILIVGEPEAGKTSLVKKLIDENYPIPAQEKEKSTLGVEVQRIEKFKHIHEKDTTIITNFWDFGGQDIQYALHQFFISTEALYILVSDYRAEKTRFSYWFQTINLLGSKQSRVIILLNKFKDATSLNEFDIESYKRDFPDLNIKSIEIDLSENDQQWRKLKELIAEKLTELPVVGQNAIKIWKAIRDKIEECKYKNFMSLKEFYEMAREQGMEGEKEKLLMLDYFHKIGVVVYFKDDLILQNDVFLNPNWITRAIYDVMSDENIEHVNGQFNKQWIFNFWKAKGYKEYECIKLLSLMQKDKFDLCYPLPDNEHKFIVPLLLPDKIPVYPWNKDKNRQVRYIYDQFMPNGIISQFIVKLNEFIACKNKKQMVWKKGVLLERQDTKAEVIEHTNGREIRIRLHGHNIPELRGKIMDNINSIISRFPKQPQILIPCTCTKCENMDEPHFFIYSNLMERRAKGVPTAGECENSYQSMRIDDILEGYKIADKEDKLDQIREQLEMGIDLLEKGQKKHNRGLRKVQKGIEETKSLIEYGFNKLSKELQEVSTSIISDIEKHSPSEQKEILDELLDYVKALKKDNETEKAEKIAANSRLEMTPKIKLVLSVLFIKYEWEFSSKIKRPRNWKEFKELFIKTEK
jgi:Leucine-rich repeat (LRR) protein